MRCNLFIHALKCRCKFKNCNGGNYFHSMDLICAYSFDFLLQWHCTIIQWCYSPPSLIKAAVQSTTEQQGFFKCPSRGVWRSGGNCGTVTDLSTKYWARPKVDNGFRPVRPEYDDACLWRIGNLQLNTYSWQLLLLSDSSKIEYIC